MVRVALIGTGFIGRTHLDVWEKMNEAEIVAVCTSSAPKGGEMAERYHCHHYQNLLQLLDQEEIDVVDICTPTFLHEENIVAAAERGLDIICEKPITRSLDSMDRILDAVRKAGVLLMAGHVLRFWAEYDMVKEMYDKGMFGRIQSVYTHRLAEYPKGTIWRHDAAGSGGGLFDLTLHDVDYLIYMFGEVETVYASGMKSKSGCWDHVSAILNFKNGINATVEGVLGMTDGYPFSTMLRMVGEHRTVEYDMSAGVNIESLSTARSSVILYENGKKPMKLNPAVSTNFEAELSYFASCVANRTEPAKIRPEEARYTLRVLLAIEESLEKRRLISLTESE